MLIGNTDIKEFGATQLTVDIGLPPTTVPVEWPTGAAVPVETEAAEDLAHIAVKLYFRGHDRDDVTLAVSNVDALFQAGVDLTLDGYSRRFKAYRTAGEQAKTIQRNRYTATWEFDGFWFGEEVRIRADGKTKIEFEARGNRKAPAVITIIPNEDVEELTLYGFNEDLTVRNIPRGATVVIDGEAGTVTQDGANKFHDFEAWDFPVVQVGEKKAHTINIAGGEKCAITIAYRPLYR